MEVRRTRTHSLTVALAVVLGVAAVGCGDEDDEPAATDAPLATEAPVETDAPPATEAPVETDAPPATEAPVETDAPPPTDAPAELAVSAADLIVRQVHDPVSIPPVLFEIFPNALSAIIVFGELPDGCAIVAVHDANGDGILGPGDEAVFSAGTQVDRGTVAIPIDRGGRYFLVKDDNNVFPVGFIGDDASLDGTQFTVGGQAFEAIGLTADGMAPASYDVDFAPENEVMTAS